MSGVDCLPQKTPDLLIGLRLVLRLQRRGVWHIHIFLCAWVRNYIHYHIWDALIHPCPNLNGGLVVNVWHGWVITPPVMRGCNQLFTPYSRICFSSFLDEMDMRQNNNLSEIWSAYRSVFVAQSCVNDISVSHFAPAILSIDKVPLQDNVAVFRWFPKHCFLRSIQWQYEIWFTVIWSYCLLPYLTHLGWNDCFQFTGVQPAIN